jgi:hypothetical protein
MGFSEKILFHFTDLILKAEKGIELHGPLFLSEKKNQALILKAIEFRTVQNLKRAPYLETNFQLELENRLSLDQRSAHFVATRGDQIVVCLRLTPGPFELSSLSKSLEDKELTHENFWEFSRLCTDIKLAQKGKVARLLLIKAGLWLFSQTKAKGIIGICKADKLRYMSKFALHQEGEATTLNHREGKYCFISAPREKILLRFMKEFLGIQQPQSEENQLVS